MQRAPEKMSITVTQSKQVIPIQDMQVASVLRGEISELKRQNEALQEHVKGLEAEVEEFKVINGVLFLEPSVP
jgi:molecular chaperone GrpE (heat shock protein)